PTPARSLVLAQALGLMVLTVFGWYALSGLRAATGSTLLPFRLIPAITLALALAGVVGSLALARWAVATSPGHSRGRVAAVAVVVAGLAAVQMVQHVSEEDSAFAAAARDTVAAPTPVMEAIDEMTPGREPSDLVVLTAVPTVYAYRPYFTFQAPAQAYATPAGRYTERTDEIRRWATATSPRELADALESGPFRGPDVLVLAREGIRTWGLPVAINEMPLARNNSRETIRFSPAQFADPELFDVREVGSRVVIVRR
ncbi:arabinofuranosyltransferase, partial [Dietzia sp. SYD-A1]|uniref:arabinofuranosyltransferase n=1 Tax=Dietzia sp. SYD-A1 TaxID=2780141 RepID=UPI0018914D3F